MTTNYRKAQPMQCSEAVTAILDYMKKMKSNVRAMQHSTSSSELIKAYQRLGDSLSSTCVTWTLRCLSSRDQLVQDVLWAQLSGVVRKRTGRLQTRISKSFSTATRLAMKHKRRHQELLLESP